MKKTLYSIASIIIFLMLIGCNKTAMENTDKSNMSDEVSYDFYTFLQSPQATEKQDFSKIIKLIITKNEGARDKTIVLDLENEEILIDPWMSSHGINSQGDTQSIDDMGAVINILETYNVQDWEDDYSTEDPSSYEDGAGWNLWLQYEDGTVQSHKGSGSGLESITPEGFDDFFNELETFVNDQI